MRNALPIILAMTLAACATAAPEDMLAKDATPATHTEANGDVITLPQAVSASGSRYATPQHEFWIKGDEATYTIGRMVPTTCRVAK